MDHLLPLYYKLWPLPSVYNVTLLLQNNVVSVDVTFADHQNLAEAWKIIWEVPNVVVMTKVDANSYRIYVKPPDGA
jgi:hypothetical protein